MASRLSRSSSSQLEIELKDAGKKLVDLPSSTAEIVNALVKTEQILSRVQQRPSESMKHALRPIIKALIAKKLVGHPDMDVNISVACCICDVLRIMALNSPYKHEQMKEFFELVVVTFEKLSSASGGCYTKMMKVLETLSSGKFLLLMSDLQLDGLIFRLFKQFLTVADSNPSAVVFKIEKIMTMIIEARKDLTSELVDLLAMSVKNDNQTASIVCSQLGKKVVKNCAAQVKQPSDMTVKRCLRYQSEKKHENKVLSIDPPTPSESVIEVIGKRKRSVTPCKKQDQSAEHGENLVGSRIKVWWPEDQIYYTGVVKFFELTKKKHKVLYDDGDEELLDLKQEQWELVKNVSPTSNSDQSAEQGENLVGRKIKVWWPLDKMFYEGVVESFDSTQKKHKVVYDDGDEDVLDLNQRRWMLSENVSAIPESANSAEHGESLVGRKIKVWWPADNMYYEGVVESFDCSTKKHKVSYDDGDEDVLDLNQRRWMLMLSENVPAILDASELCIKVSSPQSGIINVQGYRVKKSVAPILEAIFRKHGDIASDCVFTTAVRESMLEDLCEVVSRIQANDVTVIISEMKEIESKVSAAEACKINVSWLRPHLEAIHKRTDANLLMKMKASTSLAIRAAKKDLKETRIEFEKAERCVEVLNIVEKKLNDSFLESNAEKQPIL